MKKDRYIKHSLFTILLCITVQQLFAQVGGQKTYTFLNLPTSARSAAMGGDFISIRDGDANLVTDNPALLDSTMNQHATLTYINYISDVNFGYVNYVKHFSGIGTFSGGLQYISYGEFTRADAAGNKLGTFRAGEYALDVSMSRSIDSLFTVGGTFKAIYSSLEDYNSFGVAFDFGAHYLSRKKLFSAGLVINSLGTQIKPYVDDSYEDLPLEIQLGISYKLDKAPIRLSILASNLQQWDLTSDRALEEVPVIGPNGELQVDEEEDESFSIDNAARHLVFGSEILVSKNFNLRIAYNYQRRQELKTNTSSGLTGLSFGLGFKIKKINFSYALATYHVQGYSNHLTVATNIGQWKRKG